MNNTRRGFLGAVGAAVATAGCLAPTGDGGRVGVGEPASRYEQVYDRIAPSVARVQTYESTPSGTAESGQGSAFAIDDGHLLTNDHVIDGAATVRVQGADGDWTEASVAGRDPYTDLAVLDPAASVTGDALPLAEETPPIGTEVLVVGSPFGLEGSATQGIVSGRNRTIPSETGFSIPHAVQTDAALNPGNSGGPLVTLDGDVVGVATATQGENLGFAVSAPLAREVTPLLVAEGRYDHSFMGVSILDVDPLIAEANDLPEARGVYVVDVQADGPSSGVLRPADDESTVDGATVPVGGDTVVALEGTPVATDADLARFLALETRPGDTVDVTVWREGSETVVELELGARPALV